MGKQRMMVSVFLVLVMLVGLSGTPLYSSHAREETMPVIELPPPPAAQTEPTGASAPLSLVEAQTDALSEPAHVPPLSRTPKTTPLPTPEPTPEPTLPPPPKYIALSFDDGPRADTTPLLLDILQAHGARATFFVVGENAARYPAILQRMLEEGHSIGNHSYTHPYMSKLKPAARSREVLDTAQAVFEATGYTTTLFRPPYGDFSRKETEIEGHQVVFWSVDSMDWKWRDPELTLEYTLPQLRENRIILMHDIFTETLGAAELLLAHLAEEGYTVVDVPTLLAILEQGE